MWIPVLLGILFLFFPARGAVAADSSSRERPSVKILMASHLEGSGLGYNRGYTTAGGFFTFFPESPVFPFFDLRLHMFNDAKIASNVGIGMRYRKNEYIGGINGSFDYRQTHRKDYFQIGVGLEALLNRWEFRANGYAPVGANKSRFFHTKFDHFEGHHIVLRRKREFAMFGLDGEAGYHFFNSRKADLYFGLGPYYYFASKAKEFVGGRGRLALKFLKYISLEGRMTFDRVFKIRGEGLLAFNIPLGKMDRQNTEKKVSTLPVFRNEIIVTEQRKKKSLAIDPSTGGPYFVWFVDNTSSSEGTFESPFPTLVEAQNASSARDLIYVFPGDGTSSGMDAGIVLKDQQKLFGSAVAHNLNTTLGLVAIPQFSEAFPTITNTMGDAVVIANSNEISGMQIDMSGTTSGFAITTVTSVIGSPVVQNTIIADNIIRTAFVASSANHAINLVSVSGAIVISGNTVTGSLGTSPAFNYRGINVDLTGDGTVICDENAVTGFVQALRLGTNLTAVGTIYARNNTSLSCDDTALTLFSFQTSRVNALAEGNTIQMAVIRGISLRPIDVSHFTATVFGNTVSIVSPSTPPSVFDAGIFLGRQTLGVGNAETIVTISNNAVSNAPRGILVARFLGADSETMSLDISYNTISSCTNEGISITPTNLSTVTACLKGNVLRNNGSPGFLASIDGTSTLCLGLTENISTTGFQLTNGAAAGAFVIEPLVRNTGTVTTTGTLTEGSCGCQD